uniref:Uncharacterized protein n=1 Tax=Trepomonas sp. PC1 TaxID=1076344 RepID=A0A146K7S7_9EUKA|eukprot:JAP92428.1 hypothetical protein TPC1_15633 [Trepomonas sp. PC1]
MTVIELKNKQIVEDDDSQKPPKSSRLSQQTGKSHRNISKQSLKSLPFLDSTNPGNKLMKDCVQIKFFKNQVYDPHDTLFQKVAPQPIEEQTIIIQQARESNPDLQNATEAQRLLQQEQYFQNVYTEQLKLRRTVEGNSHKYKYSQQLKKTLQSNQYFNMDKTPFGAEFKREYLNLQDQQMLSGTYKTQNQKQVLSTTSKYKKVGDFDTEESRMQKLPMVFKSKEQMYEAISNQAVVKGMKLQIEMAKRKSQNKFMTELKDLEDE